MRSDALSRGPLLLRYSTLILLRTALRAFGVDGILRFDGCGLRCDARAMRARVPLAAMLCAVHVPSLTCLLRRHAGGEEGGHGGVVAVEQGGVCVARQGGASGDRREGEAVAARQTFS